MTDAVHDLQSLRAAFAGDESEVNELDDCPAMESIWEGLCGRLTGDARDALIDHLVACPACAESWRVALQPARTGGFVPRAPGSWAALVSSRNFWIGSSLVAAAVIAVSMIAPWHGLAPQPAVYRDNNQQMLTNLDPDARRVARGDVYLRWSPVGAGAHYQVEIADEKLDAVYSARGLSVSELHVPASALSELPKGSTLYWRVEAVDSTGRRVASATYSIVLE